MVWNPFRRRETLPTIADGPKRARLFSTHMEGTTTASANVVAGWLQDQIVRAAPMPVAGFGLDEAVSARFISQFGATTVSNALYGWYALQTFIGYQMCGIVAQHWLIDRMCSLPARDAVRHGFEINIVGPSDEAVKVKAKEAFAAANKQFGLNRKMRNFVRFGRVFGVRIAIFKVKSTDPLYYEKPFNPDGITPGSYEGIAQVDPYWCMPQLDALAVSDPASLNFYEPTWWQINGVRYHRSHLAIFRTEQPADILKPSYLYGGIPLPQQIMERVYAAERTANEAPQLLLSKRLISWFTELSEVMGNREKFMEHLNNFLEFRDNFGIKINDTADRMEQYDTTLSDVDEVINGQYQLVCAAGGVPYTKAMGTQPKGFNSSGDYEEGSYHEELEVIQEELTPFAERHMLCVSRSEVEPALGLAPGSLDPQVNWAPMDSPDAKEYAEINKLRADADASLIATGAIDGEDVRNRIRNDPDSGYFGITPEVPEPEDDESEDDPADEKT